MLRKTGFACALLTGLISCTNALPDSGDSGPSQYVRLVDEHGQPVVHATVHLLESESAVQVLRAAATDEDGIASFENLAKGRYVIDAAAPPLWRIGENEIDGRSVWLDGEVVTVPMHELHLVGVRLPDARLVWSSAGSWKGCEPAPQQVLREAQAWPADALVLHGFRSQTVPDDAPEMVFRVEWLGYAPFVERQAWTPASQFAGPRIVDRSELVPVPWRELPVVLRDPDGTCLPPETTSALRRHCVLVRRDDLDNHRFYRLDPVAGGEDRIAVPCGDYSLRLGNLGTLPEMPLAIEADTVSIDCTLPVRLRVLCLRIQGAAGTGWAVRATSSGQDFGLWLPNLEEVEIPLLVGESVLEFENYLEGGGFERRTLRVTMRDEDVRKMEWDVR